MKKLIACLFASVLAVGVAVAADLQVAQGVITTQVSNRQPVDEVKSTSASVGRLYCFTKIAGAASETSVDHVWYLGGKEVSRVKLAVKGDNWRVNSYKTIHPDMKGEWKVDVVDPAGKVLATIPFTVN